MLQRGATNLHFAKIASSILIPPFTNPIWKVVDDPHNWGFLSSGVAEGGEPDETRLRMFAELRRLDLGRLREVVRQKLTGVGMSDESQTEEEYRHSEYRALLESQTKQDEEFVTCRPNLSEYEDWVRGLFDQIVLVEKLAETRVLTGFSRINPPPYREFDRADQLQLSLKRQPWLPGVRVFGEGIFFTLNEQAVQDWLGKQKVGQRYEEITKNLNRVYARLGRTPRVLSTRFFLLHTLAHALIRRLSFECGYGSSSLRERLYCSEDESCRMSGVLIYTATTTHSPRSPSARRFSTSPRWRPAAGLPSGGGTCPIRRMTGGSAGSSRSSASSASRPCCTTTRSGITRGSRMPLTRPS
jgi:hypothetical protein